MTYTLYVPQGQDLLEWAEGYAPPTPPAPTTKTLLGMATSTQDQWRQLVDGMGPIPVRRSYMQEGDIPSTFSQSAAGDDVATFGAPTSFLSLRPGIAATNSGSLDAKIDAFAASCPRGLWLTVGAEYDRTHADDPNGVIAMYRRWYQRCKAANPYMRIGRCWMAYTFNSAEAPGYASRATWMQDLGQVDDFISFDGYNKQTGGDAVACADVFNLPVATARGIAPKLPIVIAETGTVADRAHGDFRANWLRDAWLWARDEIKMPIFAWWNGNNSEYAINQDDAALAVCHSIIDGSI